MLKNIMTFEEKLSKYKYVKFIKNGKSVKKEILKVDSINPINKVFYVIQNGYNNKWTYRAEKNWYIFVTEKYALENGAKK